MPTEERRKFSTDSTPTTHPGNSSTAVKRAENSLLPVEAAAALVASTVRESILAISAVTTDGRRKERMEGEKTKGGTPQKNRDLQPNPVLRPMDVFFLAFFHPIQRGFGIGIGTIRRELEDQRPAEWQQFNSLQVNMSAAKKTENVITLKGSVAVVSEFFYCAINSILYQRGEFVVRPNCSTDFWPTREGVELLI